MTPAFLRGCDVSFHVGMSKRSCHIKVIQDHLVEAEEMLEVLLVSPEGTVIGSIKNAQVIISDTGRGKTICKTQTWDTEAVLKAPGTFSAVCTSLVWFLTLVQFFWMFKKKMIIPRCAFIKKVLLPLTNCRMNWYSKLQTERAQHNKTHLASSGS